MVPTFNDPVLYYKLNPDEIVSGLRASYVDDSLLAGTNDFKEFSEISCRN